MSIRVDYSKLFFAVFISSCGVEVHSSPPNETMMIREGEVMSSAGPQGWCCRDRKVFEGFLRPCEESGGTLFLTPEEAHRHCMKGSSRPGDPLEPDGGAERQAAEQRGAPVEATPITLPGPQGVRGGQPAATYTGEARTVRDTLEGVRRASRTLAAIADEPIPEGLSKAQKRQLVTYSKFLRESSQELDAFVKHWGEELTRVQNWHDGSRAERTQRLTEMHMSMDLKLLELQQKIQSHSRKISILSNVMKKRHDTEKSAISNIRS